MELKYTEVESNRLKKKYLVVVDKQTISQHKEKKIKNLQSKANIKGFRKGKVPYNYLEKRFGESVQQEIINNFINQSLDKILKDEKKIICSNPEVDFVNQNLSIGNIEFNLSFEVMPNVPDVKNIGLTLVKYNVDIKNEDVDEYKNKIIKSVTDKKEKTVDKKGEVKVEKNDFVEIDFVGTIDGKEFDGGKAENYLLEIGSNSFVANFEEQLIGKKKGAKDIKVKVKFPEKYHSKDLAKKNALFMVDINNVFVKELPEQLDEKLFKKIGVKDEKELNTQIEKNLQDEIEQMNKIMMRKLIQEQIPNKLKIDIPEQIEKEQRKQAEKQLFPDKFKQLEEKLKQKNNKTNNTDETDNTDSIDDTNKTSDTEEISFSRSEEKKINEEIQKKAKIMILFAHLKNNVSASDEEVMYYIFNYCKNFPLEQQEQMLMQYMKNDYIKQMFKSSVLEEKIFDFIINNVDIKNKDVSLANLKKIFEAERE